MSLSTNQIAGLSSGIDWRTMIDQLMEVEHRTVDLIEDRKSEYEAKLAEWQSLNSTLLALKTAVEGLRDPEDFSLFSTGMSSDNSDVEAGDIISATTDTNASTGSYTVKVTNMAQAQKVSSNPFSNQNTELGSSHAGDILINGVAVTINTTDSLTDVADSINSANTGTDPSGVTATVVNYGTNDYRLILTNDSTGAEGIGLLNGSSTDLVQKFGWKDNQTATLRNAITGGAQSERFTVHNVAIKSLLGLSSGEVSTGTLSIGGTAVTINLSTMSLTDIKDAINNASITGVTASVVSQTVGGTNDYRLQIDGTQTFVDEKNILNTLGILDHNSSVVKGKISGNPMTSDGEYITGATILKDTDGYNTFTAGGNPAGDYITLSGTDTSGTGIGSVNFDISSTTTVQDLLDEVETRYGSVIAYVTSDGKIRVDDLTGGTNLVVNIADHIQDANSSLEFVTADADFGAATDRKREIVAGEDATVEIDGVQVTSTTNVIEDVIEGVTLNFVKEDDTTTVTLKVERDTAAIKENIQNFVTQYNGVMSYINTQFYYDQDSEAGGGILFGDSTLRSVKSDLTSLLTESVWGVDSDFSVLGVVGIETQIDENNQLTLGIDDSTLTGYLQTNFNDVMSLFAGQGSVSSSSLAYLGYSKDSEAGEYTVHINRAATRGTETGDVDLSGGGADETLAITLGNDTASIGITSGMGLDDIKNAINAELDTEYAETLVGDEALYSDGSQSNAITSETTWDSIYDSGGAQPGFSNDEVISFSGTDRDGNAVSGGYTITNVTSDSVQGLLSAIENAFSSEVTASMDSSGRIVITDKYAGTSQLSINHIKNAGEDEFFGTLDITSGGGDGSHEGRYAMGITATDDGNNHLVLRSDYYGNTSFSVSQDTSDNNYDHILYTATGNTKESSSGTVEVGTDTTWNNVYGADATDNDTVTISGKKRNGTDFSTNYTYTITDVTSDTVGDLLGAIENAFSSEGTTVDAFIRDGKIHVEDSTAGNSSIALTLSANNEGGGSLGLGTFDQTTERDLDLGLINGNVAGRDVAGTIGGETATGLGQTLTGMDGNTNTDGLAVMYVGATDGADAGKVTLTLGVAEMLDRILFNITDPFDGYVFFKEESIENSIDSFETQIEQMEERLGRKMDMMINRFVAMEMAISKMKSQSDWLTGQINASLSGWGWS